MHYTLSSLLALASLSVGVAAAGSTTSENPYPNPALQLQKRDTSLAKRTWGSDNCFLGILCWGTSEPDYYNDSQNCGRKGNKCKDNWPGGYGAKCSNGVCGAAQCSYNLWDFNWLQFKCQDVSADTNNCGRCGQTCTTNDVPGSASVRCVAGDCTATSCKAGFTLNGGDCTSCPAGWAYNAATKRCQDVRSDMNNCGGINQLCSIPRGSGKCSNGQCLVESCRSGCHNLGDNTCTEVDTKNDQKNCGQIKNDCSSQYPNGVGGCKNSQCYLKDCNDGFKEVSTPVCWFGLYCNDVTETCERIDTDNDMDNCGSRGKKCPRSDPNGSNAKCSNKACVMDCKPGFSWDTELEWCRRTDNDVNHCGSCRNKCPTEKGTPRCNNGQCSYSQCNNGFILFGDDCIKTDTTTDVKNCGRVGNQCKTSDFPSATGVECVASTCRGICPANFDYDPVARRCRNVQNDNDHCGRCNTPCAIPNGVAQCSNGQCNLVKCNDNYDNILGKCILQDSNTNVNGCGPSRTKCSFPLGAGICQAGKCTYTECKKPYTLTAAGTCTVIDTDNDPKNCGKVGKTCGPYPNSLNPNAAGQCNNGRCNVKCKDLYDFDVDEDYCRPVDKDPNHCGGCGRVCKVEGALQTKCDKGLCTATSCIPGYTLNSQGTCTKVTASQKARAQKKSKIIAAKSLCPDQETACPIAGSASFASSLTHHFSAFADVTTGMETAGGYECLDTKTSLDSCGGCASTGEGEDCTKIRGAVGVTCADSACVVLSCEAGWRPNLASTKCIRAHHDVHNATRAHGSRRHLSARHGHHS